MLEDSRLASAQQPPCASSAQLQCSGKSLMKCFIASALGRPDVDAVYDKCVIPVLERLRVAVSRVDRVEHNDDIDDKIFALLDAADFAIADLSYARPSVYYEAGYAAGAGKP